MVPAPEFKSEPRKWHQQYRMKSTKGEYRGTRGKSAVPGIEIAVSVGEGGGTRRKAVVPDRRGGGTGD